MKTYLRRWVVAGALLSAGEAAEIQIGGQTFTLPDGFTIEQVAGPDLVERPISIDFDEGGRMFVTDSSGSNEPVETQLEKKPHRVLRLEDTDGDGVFDRRTLFADGMMFPEGILCFRGSVYVSAPPVIWKLTDVDDDGVADQREEWFNGGILTHCANDLHGPYRGLDGWIYWCKGGFAEQTIRNPGQPPLKSRASHIFRARPDGTRIEPVFTAGMDNPVGVAFTPTGERILSGTFFQQPAAGRRDGLIHAIYGGVYGKVNDVLDGHIRTGDLMPVLTHLGPAAPCGIARYDSAVFGPAYQDNVFVCSFNLHKVSRHVLIPEGATYRTIDSDFVVSDSTDFHPTDVREDADGSLLIVDTGGWYKLCCPTSQLSKPDVLGGIYRVRRLDGAAGLDPRGVTLAWKDQPSTELARRLADPRPAVRTRTMDVLAQSGADAVPALSQTLANSTDAAQRRQIIWALSQIDAPEARAAARAGLADESASVRHAAISVAGVWRDAAAKNALLEILRGDDPPLQRAAAEALGRLGDASALPDLFAALEKIASDRVLEHSLIYAIIEIGNGDAVRTFATEGPSVTRRAALIALDQMPAVTLEPDLVVPLLASDDPVLKQTAAWIFENHPEWSDLIVPQLAASFEKLEPQADPDTASWQEFLANFATGPEFQKLIAEKAGDQKAAQPARLLALRVMGRAGLRDLPASWATALTTALTADDEAVRNEAVKAARAQKIKPAAAPDLVKALRELAGNSTVPPAQRLTALSAIPGDIGRLDSETFAFLRQQLTPEISPMARAEAATALARVSPDEAQTAELIQSLHEAGPASIPLLLNAIARTPSEVTGFASIEALEQAAGLATLPPGTLRAWMDKFPESVQTRGHSLLERVGPE
ncbi:MAG: PVC-type heme-binding CxxCH protein, partial [Chthoniobacteraceae bacterium]